jgi:hypothetical protein
LLRKSKDSTFIKEQLESKYRYSLKKSLQVWKIEKEIFWKAHQNNRVTTEKEMKAMVFPSQNIQLVLFGLFGDPMPQSHILASSTAN